SRQRWEEWALEERFWRSVNRTITEYPGSLTHEEARPWLKPWLRSMGMSRGPLSDGLPWMPFPAIEFLETLLTPDAKVFEFGSGGSTIFFAARVCELVTVEHDADWLSRAAAALSPGERRKWRDVLRVPQPRSAPAILPPSDPLSYDTSDDRFRG